MANYLLFSADREKSKEKERKRRALRAGFSPPSGRPLFSSEDQAGGKAEDDAQKITDKAIKDIDGICAAKEKEIMEV